MQIFERHLKAIVGILLPPLGKGDDRVLAHAVAIAVCLRDQARLDFRSVPDGQDLDRRPCRFVPEPVDEEVKCTLIFSSGFDRLVQDRGRLVWPVKRDERMNA